MKPTIQGLFILNRDGPILNRYLFDTQNVYADSDFISVEHGSIEQPIDIDRHSI